MRRTAHPIITATLAVAAFQTAAAVPAAAADVPAGVPAGPRSAMTANHDTVPVTGAATFASPLPAASLVELRGGEAVTTNVVDVHGRVDGNTANNVTSGLNVIQDGSFGNASGITTVIQNSGSNVLIQNGTVVNVRFVDPVP